MDIFALIGALGGGIIGAYIGGVPAFILTGVFTMIGAAMAAVGGTEIMTSIAFGSMFGPHIAFGGAVAAAAYAGKKGKLSSGTDIVASLNGLNSPDVLLVGGAFGVLGYILWYIVCLSPFGSGMLGTDAPGMVVFISGIIARLAFGKTGITGKYTGTGPRTYISTGTAMTQNIVLGGGLGLAMGCMICSLIVAFPDHAASIMNNFPLIAFGFAAFTLIFIVAGNSTPGVHHIVLPASLAAVVGILAFGAYGGIAMGVIFGILGSLLGDFAGNTFNSHCDSHIDPPAFAIFTLTIVISILRTVLVG